MMGWHFIGMILALLLFLCAAILYEKHLCSKIDKQLTRLEKFVEEQGERR